jgi:hypothetical protein
MLKGGKFCVSRLIVSPSALAEANGRRGNQRAQESAAKIFLVGRHVEISGRSDIVMPHRRRFRAAVGKFLLRPARDKRPRGDEP